MVRDTDRAKRREEAKQWRRHARRRAFKTFGIVVAVLVSAVPALFLADPIAYVPPIAFVLALAFSYGSLAYVAKNLRIDEEMLESSCSRGEDVMLDVEVDNRAIVPVTRMEMTFVITDAQGGVDVSSTAHAAVGGRQNLPLSFDATFAHLGMYLCGIDHVVLHDYFGFFTRRLDLMHGNPISVLPKRFDIGEADLTRVSQQESQNLFKTITSDDSDYAGVREYRFGDPMKTVHWNLSSRDPHERLFTRLFEVQAEPGLAVIVDPYAPSYADEELRGTFDALIESAASVSAAARRQGVDTEVRFLGTDGAPASLHLARVSDVDDMVEAMLPVTRADEVASAQEAALMLEREVRSRGGHDNVAYCTSRVGEDVIQMLLSLRMRGRNPMLFFAVPRTIGDEERRKLLAPLKRLGQAGVNYFVVNANESTTEVRAL